MNEEERKAFKVINTRTRRLLDELEIEKEDMSDEPKIAYLMQEIRANKTILNLIEKLQKENEALKSENRRLKVIRYSTEYGTENIHLITKSDLVQIDINKYMIEIEKGKFVDLKQVYQENIELKNNGPIDENEFEFAVDCDWDRLKRLIDTADKSEEYILYKNEKWIKEKYCVPVQKVKNKIELLEEKTKYEQNTQVLVQMHKQIKVLKELL